ncbi:MAG: hypothetical protein HRU15_07805, partial [Planctomycetes bacterium]|nr:hypothetical protein [Planctomycetota bacterium]
MNEQHPLLTLRLWPQHHMDTKLRDQLVERCDTSFVDCVWLCTPIEHVSYQEHQDAATAMCEAADLFRAKNISVGIQLAQSLGHGDGLFDNTHDVPWKFMHDYDGRASKSGPCPRDPQFHQYLEKVLSIYGQVKPDHVWIDDDLRLAQHHPIEHSCFCPRCIDAFAGADSREDLLSALHDDFDIRQQWIQFGAESLAMIAAACTRGMHSEHP